MLKITEENFQQVYTDLVAFFPAEEVQSRALTNPKDGQPNGKGQFEGLYVSPVAFYVDARSIYNRLNAVLWPHNWQSRQTMYPEGVVCELGIKINDEWIWKADGSEYTAMEGTKGGLSKGIVRAAVSWGIGAYFYDVKTVYHPMKQVGKNWYLDYNHGVKNVAREPQLPKEFLP